MNTQNRSNSGQGSQDSGSLRGFARMSDRDRQAAASKGGSTTASRYDMSERGRKGGRARGKNSNRNNNSSR